MKPSAARLQCVKAWMAATLVLSVNTFVVHFSPTLLGVVQRY